MGGFVYLLLRCRGSLYSEDFPFSDCFFLKNNFLPVMVVSLKRRSVKFLILPFSKEYIHFILIIDLFNQPLLVLEHRPFNTGNILKISGGWG